ncbi:small integral membrane protein 26-like [Enoplosus armatus]|uniref:small integral membrane protein 26-like n=1 Tax=Enoplosus armatus TaxID=215367 RepID=UPI003991E967
MKFKDLMKWNTRMSAVYAAGIWTMIGSYAYFRYTGRYAAVQTGEVQEPADPNKVVYQTAHTKTIIVYKEGFVPYTTRIFSFFKSLRGDPGSGDSGK